MKAFLAGVCLLMLNGAVYAADAQVSTFQAGVVAYQAKDFDQAALQFKALVESGTHSGPIYYDLGNAYFRQGKLGLALAAYLEALRFTPRDRDLRYNLDYVRRQVKDKIEPNQWNAVKQTGFFWMHALSAREWLWSASLASLVFWTCLALRRQRPLGVAAVVLIVTLAGLAGATIAAPERGVVIEPEITVYSGPGSINTQLFRLHEGAEFNVRDRDAAWLRVELVDGKQGWVETRLTSLQPVGGELR